ncbi:MAG TPA: TonB-dependent receptor [Methylotenera sp.]|nr:TonB-dependent receptor [Methylotenera sp.]HPN02270.1 TonB-dependent receptor [Methylotenera sp.]
MTRFKLTKHPFPLKPIRILLLSAGFSLASLVQAADLNTAIPESTNASFSAPINIDMPTMPLDLALQKFAKLSGMSIGFDNTLAQNKSAPAIKGRMTRKEALQKLLVGSGLMAAIDGDNVVVKKLVNPQTTELQLDKINIRAKRSYEIGPLPGLGLTKEEIPGNVQSITAKEIKESHSLSLADLMNSKLQSVSVNDYQGNPFQMDVNYRGFTASPQLGTAQGISVFLDGIRVNEPFGDVVNWDMIPMNALSSLDMFPGSNPIFGLGTLGGALTMRTKSGFTEPGLDAEILAGSYGRKQLQISAGGNNGVIAGFASGNFFLEDGWRDNSPSKVNQVFSKAEWRNEKVQLGLSMLYAGNKLTGNGLLPEQMAAENRSQVYTSPDKSKNDLLQFQLSGIWDVTDNFNVTGQLYNRKSKRKSKTTDVNENFNGFASPDATGKQVLYGYSDINNDGLPDYNTYVANVAADANGYALDNNGNSYQIDNGTGTGTFVINPAFDINNLAIGTNSGTAVPSVGQATLPRNDGLSGPDLPRWTADPRAIESPDLFTAPISAGLGEFNKTLPVDFFQFALDIFGNQSKYVKASADFPFFAGGTFAGADEFGNPRGAKYVFGLLPDATAFDMDNGYVDENGFFNRLIVLDPVNSGLRDPNIAVTACSGSAVLGVCENDANGYLINRDGAYSGIEGTDGLELGVGAGVIEGTPTALITETEIDQVGTGGALQLNWNLDKHKLMVGASIDKADASYISGQYLGLLDAKRSGTAAPSLLGYEFFARDAEHALRLNDFSGDSITKSIYASETWTPIKALNITAAARFNHTTVKNKLDVNNLSKYTELTLQMLRNEINPLALCHGVDTDGDGLVDGTECPTGIDGALVPFAPENFFDLGSVESTRPEKFSFRSFNPALGATWQASETLNVYANWNRGARTPTVIELGCAYDDTLIQLAGTDPPIYQERSLADRRTCNLPTTMSGDPYLKQVRSKTLEVGARGLLTSNIEWNTSFYRTDLTDDIYFVSIAPSRSFFQNIGDTKRQGLEMGLKGKLGKASFGLNYSLTDATFQSDFQIISPYNSTANNIDLGTVNAVIDGKAVQINNFGKIDVKKGNRVPGTPLHNLNANFSYEVTDKWMIGLNAVMHSSAFVRGNENNKHKAGPAEPVVKECLIPDPSNPGNYMNAECYISRADWSSGKTPGYTVFNLQTSYKLTPEWTLGMQINNLFDKEYASAGRLGLNAFSLATYGSIGASGFNYNSSEWQGTSFLGLGAPRSAYFTLTFQFASDYKSNKSEAEAITVDLPLPSRPAEK